ncbi:vacuolar-processing enzyme [Carica papaya]|uniref:vacuolar-processing enzyme n=1 Tax=Carica papaya TaxID=3649 RepID=UPI000B8CAD4F|nr:vacuolar-processing enzyme [Carica papaya]
MISSGSAGRFIFVILLLLSLGIESHEYTNTDSKQTKGKGKRWAVLIAGSSGYENYRHQADICHAYQILKSGGLDDKNIIVFMYDDIAFSQENPRPGIVINNPLGKDVYHGVPKDYTGDDVNSNNFFAVILGNKTALTGGSGKVVDSGPDDHIFIYYADHGSPGYLGMPSYEDEVTAKDFIHVLKKKHEAKSYKKMVIYVEACESGSIFDGLLPDNMNIYAVTAANPNESSWGYYCPGDTPDIPPEYDTCLGDLFSISWMEDSDMHDVSKETLKEQYKVVKNRTATTNKEMGSHVMQYGSLDIANDFLSGYLGENYPVKHKPPQIFSHSTRLVSQYDAELLHFQHEFLKAPKNSEARNEARKKLQDEIFYRKQIDYSIKQIAMLLLGEEDGPKMLTLTQPAGHPLVQDWDCFKTLIKSLKKNCGWSSSSSRYGMKYTRVVANICNAGINMEHADLVMGQAFSMKFNTTSIKY